MSGFIVVFAVIFISFLTIAELKGKGKLSSSSTIVLIAISSLLSISFIIPYAKLTEKAQEVGYHGLAQGAQSFMNTSLSLLTISLALLPILTLRSKNDQKHHHLAKYLKSIKQLRTQKR